MKQSIIKRSLLLLVFLILAAAVQASTIYDFLDSIDQANTILIYADEEDYLVWDKAMEFANAFGIMGMYSESSIVYEEGKNIIVISTFVNSYGLQEKFLTENWPFEDLANGYVQLEASEGISALYITGEDFASTIATIDSCINYNDHEAELDIDFVLLTDGVIEPLDPTCDSDTDNGDYYTSGYLLPDNIQDECANPAKLTEYTCINNRFSVEDVDCLCELGACQIPTLESVFVSIERMVNGEISLEGLLAIFKTWLDS